MPIVNAIILNWVAQILCAPLQKVWPIPKESLNWETYTRVIPTRSKSRKSKGRELLQVRDGVNERKTNPEHTKFTRSRTSTIRHIYVRISLLYSLMVVDAPLKRRKLTSIDSMEAETAKVLSFFFPFFFFPMNFTLCKIFLIFNLCTCSNICFCYWVDLGFVWDGLFVL